MKHLLTALVICGLTALGQPAPTSVAIRNAKIVTVSGAVIAKGTVVVRNGLIEAVGDSVSVPADAQVIEKMQIRWPDGTVEEHAGLASNREYVIRQGEKS